MMIGLCGKPELAPAAKAAGFAYLELPVNGVAAMTDVDFARTAETLAATGLPCSSFNLLFPGTMQLLERETRPEDVSAYLHHAFRRVQLLGGTVAVFGSGRSRRRPDDMSYGEAFRRLVEMTRLTGEIAAQYGVTIVIEPLCRAETNMINYVSEGAALAAAVNHPNVKLLADYYHMAKDHEIISDIARLGGISHAHIATAEGRRYPTADEAGFHAFFAALKASGYTGNLSVEGNTDDIAADGPVSVALLRKLWEEA